MSGTISTVLTNTYTLSVDPTTITQTGGVEVGYGPNGYEAAIVGPSPTAWALLNEGTVTATNDYGVILNAGGTITNAAGALIRGGVHPVGSYYDYGGAILINGAPGTIVNAGTIGGTAYEDGTGIILTAGGSVTNRKGGVIDGWGQGIESVGTASVTVTNAGTISNAVIGAGRITNSAGGTIGSADIGEPGTVINAGTMYGVLMGGGYLRNAAGGVITNPYSTGVTIGRDVGTVVNGGSITGKTTFEGSDGIAYDGAGIRLWGGGSVTNGSGGVITGGGPAGGGIFAGGTGVVISGGAGMVVNAGTITGGTDAVVMAAGYANRLVDEPGAVFNGTVDGGNAIGGPASSTLELAAGGPGTLYNLNIQFVDFSDVAVDKGADWTIAASNGEIGAGQTLTDSGTILFAPIYETYTVSGEVALDGGTLSTDVFTIAAGGVVAGSGTISSAINSDSGSLVLAAHGTLDAMGGTLTLQGYSNISGALDGEAIAFEGGTVTLEKGVQGSVREIDLDDTLKLGPGLNGTVYRGAFNETSGASFDPRDNNVTLAGPVTMIGSSRKADIHGSGRLTLADTAQLGGVSVGGGELLVNAGSLVQSGSVALGESASLRNATAGTWDITADTGIGLEIKANGDITNAGTFEKTGGTGTSVISTDFVNYGTIIAESGTLEFTGGFANHGRIIDNGGTVIIGPASPALFNQHVAGAAPASSASIVAAAPPETKNTPLLATPHAA